MGDFGDRGAALGMGAVAGVSLCSTALVDVNPTTENSATDTTDRSQTMAHLLLSPIIMGTTPAAMDVVPLTGLSLFQYNDRTRPLSIKHVVCHTKDPRKSSAHYCSTFAYIFLIHCIYPQTCCSNSLFTNGMTDTQVENAIDSYDEDLAEESRQVKRRKREKGLQYLKESRDLLATSHFNTQALLRDFAADTGENTETYLDLLHFETPWRYDNQSSTRRTLSRYVKYTLLQ